MQDYSVLFCSSFFVSGSLGTSSVEHATAQPATMTTAPMMTTLSDQSWSENAPNTRSAIATKYRQTDARDNFFCILLRYCASPKGGGLDIPMLRADTLSPIRRRAASPPTPGKSMCGYLAQGSIRARPRNARSDTEPHP